MESATHYRNGKSKAKNPRKIKYNPGQLKMDIEESEALQRFLRKRLSFAKSSEELYKSHVTTYCYFHQKKIDELIEIYLEDQQNPPEDDEDFKVYNDILDYAKHSIDNKQAKSTILGKVKRIKTFLKDNKVIIPEIRIDLSKYDDTEGYYTKRDLPDKKTMQLVINGSNFKYKAMYAFAYTTGSGRSEIANLKVIDFINAISEFCQTDKPKDMINELDGHTRDKENLVVPAIRMTRQKTHKPYYTVTTPECVQMIIDYIKTDYSILDNLDGRLFGIQAGAVGNAFKETNLKYGFGKRGRYNFFGCHRLRHNHYTQINNNALACMLEGRNAKDKIDNIYNHNDDPEMLIQEYKNHMHKFEIFDKYELQINSEAMEKLQNENEELREKIAEYENTIEDLKQSSTHIETRIESIEDQLNKTANETTIKQLINYASNHKLVKENNLMSIVMELYYDKQKEGNTVYLDEQTMENLVYLANNIKTEKEREINKSKVKDQEFYEDNLQELYDTYDELHKIAKDIIVRKRYEFSTYQQSLLCDKLMECSEELIEQNISVKDDKVKIKIQNLVTEIAKK